MLSFVTNNLSLLEQNILKHTIVQISCSYTNAIRFGAQVFVNVYIICPQEDRKESEKNINLQRLLASRARQSRSGGLYTRGMAGLV